MPHSNANIDELRKNAVLFWPSDLRSKVALISILPHLLKTQDFFISVLNLSGDSPDAWKDITSVTGNMPANLFLKHLMVLSDLGRETLSKIVPLTQYFPGDVMNYIWREKTYSYKFQHFTKPAYEAPVTNSVLGIINANLLAGKALTPAMEDIIMLLLFGSTSIEGSLPEGYAVRCQIGELMGEPDLLKKFVKENYIRVSPQIRGQTANASGQVVQDYVKAKLKTLLPDWHIKSGQIPGVSHDDGATLTSTLVPKFDIN